METNSFSIKKVITYAGALIGFLIGSAFATGQEVLQFFAAYGLWGSLGATAFTSIIMVFMSTVIMEDARVLQLKKPADLFKYYCGKHVGIAMEVITAIYLFSLFVVMVAGGGSVLQEHYGISKWIGSLATALVALGINLLGLKNIVNILGKIGPIKIVAVIGVSIVALCMNFGELNKADEFLLTHQPLKAAKYWWISGLLFPAELCIFMVTFLAAMGTTASSKKEAMAGGALGGIAFSVAILAVSLGIVSTMPHVFGMQAPTIGMANLIYPGLGTAYSVIVILGIFTTSIPLLWVPIMSVTTDEKSTKFKVLAVLTVIIALIGSQVDFSRLINIIIPLAGWMGIIVPISIFLKHMHIKIPGYNTTYNSSADFETKEQ